MVIEAHLLEYSQLPGSQPTPSLVMILQLLLHIL
jgi:hypothetical protein